MRFVLAMALLFPVMAVAQEGDEPTYDDCFALMQKKLEAAQVTADVEAEAIQGLDHTAPATERSANQQALDKAVEGGIPVVIDPFAENGSNFKGEIEITINPEDEKPPHVTKEDKCRVLYGLTF